MSTPRNAGQPAAQRNLGRVAWRYLLYWWVMFALIEGIPESNFVLRDALGREIDVHPVRFDEAGNGIYRMEDGGDWSYAAAGFDGRGSIAGRAVSCLTAEMQMVGHAGGYTPHETDFHDMRLLHQRFGTALLGPYAEADPPTG